MHKYLSMVRMICALLGWLLPAGAPLLAQSKAGWSEFASLPDPEGMAGMYAGASGGRLFCMGGANFPDKKPWEGGTKVWYDVIFGLKPDGIWERLEQRLPNRMAYGVSAEYQDELILVGGSQENAFHSTVWGMKWKDGRLVFRSLPSLPVSLANMAGCRVGKLLIVAGGNESPTGQPTSRCLALDLEHMDAGWFELPAWPGPARAQCVAGSHKGDFFLFSGEGVGRDSAGVRLRTLYRDAYRLSTRKQDGKWNGEWVRLADLPGSVSASANPVPSDRQGRFYLWGGVSETIARHRDPATHPGIEKKLLVYASRTQTWETHGTPQEYKSRVTLPAVHWKGQWLFVSGEIRPGVRTPSIMALRTDQGKSK